MPLPTSSVLIIPTIKPTDNPDLRYQNYIKRTVRFFKSYAKGKKIVILDLLDPVSLGSLILRPIMGKGALPIVKLKRAWYVRPLGLLPMQRFTLVRKTNILLILVYFRFLLLPRFSKRWTFLVFSLFPNTLVSDLFLKTILSAKKIIFVVFELPYSENPKEQSTLTKWNKRFLKKSQRVLVYSNYVKRKLINEFGVKETKIKTLTFWTWPQNSIKKSLQKPSPSKKPIIGMMETLDFRLDFNLLEMTLKRYPNFSFIFVFDRRSKTNEDFYLGTAGKIARLNRYSNLLLKKVKNRNEALAWINLFDACLLPYDIKQKRVIGTHPEQFYHYLRFGKPIVSVNLPAIKKYSKLYYLSRSDEEFLKNIKIAASEKVSTELIKKRVRVSQKNSWSKGTSILEKI